MVIIIIRHVKKLRRGQKETCYTAIVKNMIIQKLLSKYQNQFSAMKYSPNTVLTLQDFTIHKLTINIYDQH